MFFCFVPVHFRIKDRLPRHRMVQLWVKVGKIRTFDNIFFGGIILLQGSEAEYVTILAGFYLIFGQGLDITESGDAGFGGPSLE